MFAKMFFLIILALAFRNVNSGLQLSTNVMVMEKQRMEHFQVEIGNAPGDTSNKILVLIPKEHSEITIMPNNFEVEFNESVKVQKYFIELFAFKAGKSGLFVITTTLLPEITCVERTFLSVEVYKSEDIQIVSTILGWFYFLAWSLSCYPQMYTNYKRKSVVGVSFDFVCYNMFGYVMYNMFNLGMYFMPFVQEEYSQRNPTSIIPVYLNDVVFSLHSLFATVVIAVQCFIYEKGNQRVHLVTKVVLGLDLLIVTVVVTLAYFGILQFLDVLYACSYIKLVITVTKCIPQVYLNYQRRSTNGFSIGTSLLDVSGSITCLLQMTLDSYNYGDWKIILDNLTKFCLAAVSLVFDIIFMIQHYIVYRVKKEVKMCEDGVYQSKQQA